MYDSVARLGVVTGLKAEAEVVEAVARAASSDNTEIIIRSAGADADRARGHAAALVSGGVDGLLSFGVGGGLDPALVPGDLIVATAICRCDGVGNDCDAGWRDRLLARLGDSLVQSARIVGADALIDQTAVKQRLFARTGAAAVDMESGAVAGVAAAASLPFLASRAIADPATRAPPAAALAAVRPDGGIRPPAAVAAAAANPALIPLFVKLALDNRAAMATLRRVATLAGPLFGLV